MFREKLQRAVLRGIKNTLAVLWLLTKVMVPATLIVTFLDISGWLGYLSAWFSPFMGWLGLPGEAAVPLVAGNISGLYAGAGAMTVISLTAKQQLILAAMLMLSHSLPQEGAIVAQAGGKTAMVIAMRIGTALATGLVLQWII
ncbi:MAG TPA: hypothetical protein GXX69_02820 [Firmicutes bacterium]|nr:hypothetical protein [Bacillota bacterium]